MDPKDNKSKELPGAFSLFQPSWEAIQVNLVTFIELVLVPLLFVLVGSIIKHATGAFLESVGEILAILFSPGIYLTQLKSVRKNTVDFSQAVKEGLHYFWRFFGLVICMFVIIGIGFLLLIVPGFFMLRRYILAPYYLLDRDMKIFDAMKASAEDSKEFSMAIWGLIGVEVLLGAVLVILQALLGWIYIVGLVFYYIYYCAPAVRYFEIKNATKTKTSTS
jgi:hypothetical protein